MKPAISRRGKKCYRALSVILIFLSGQMALAKEGLESRVVRQSQTIDELSQRVSELKKENERLSSALSEMLAAQRSGTTPRLGCDVRGLENSVIFENNAVRKSDVIMNWLKSNGFSCKREQLRSIRVFTLRQIPNEFTNGEVIRALDALLNR